MFTILKTVKKGEYIYAVVTDHPKANKHGYVLLHRVVMENYLNRLLNPNEIVHHKDGNKHNNVLSNLELMDSKEHNRMHSSTGRNIIELVCPFCGKTFLEKKDKLKKENTLFVLDIVMVNFKDLKHGICKLNLTIA